MMTTEAFSRDVGNLFSELKLVTDNLSIYAAANWEALDTYFRIPPHDININFVFVHINFSFITTTIQSYYMIYSGSVVVKNEGTCV